MASLITELRGMANAGTADYTLGTATYWDGDQVQRVLDRNRMDVYREQLTKVVNHLAAQIDGRGVQSWRIARSEMAVRHDVLTNAEGHWIE